MARCDTWFQFAASLHSVGGKRVRAQRQMGKKRENRAEDLLTEVEGRVGGGWETVQLKSPNFKVGRPLKVPRLTMWHCACFTGKLWTVHARPAPRWYRCILSTSDLYCKPDVRGLKTLGQACFRRLISANSQTLFRPEAAEAQGPCSTQRMRKQKCVKARNIKQRDD